MADLDCGSFESALESLAVLLNQAPGSLLDRLRRFDFEALPESERRSGSYSDLLVRHTVANLLDPLPIPEQIVWFHATRLARRENFSRGILPLPQIVPDILSLLGQLTREIVTESEWQQLQSKFENFHSRNLAEKMAHGPCAFLVRQTIFKRPGSMYGDYLGCSEVVWDICSNFDEDLRLKLLARYKEVTEPCIVVFRYPSALYQNHTLVPAALMYIHRIARLEELSDGCNTFMNADGVAIPAEAIIRIERNVAK